MRYIYLAGEIMTNAFEQYFGKKASIEATKMERIVYDAVKKFKKGCITDDVERALPNIPLNSITPRFSSLLRKGFIIDTGERRKGRSGKTQRVMK